MVRLRRTVLKSPLNIVPSNRMAGGNKDFLNSARSITLSCKGRRGTGVFSESRIHYDNTKGGIPFHGSYGSIERLAFIQHCDSIQMVKQRTIKTRKPWSFGNFEFEGIALKLSSLPLHFDKLFFSLFVSCAFHWILVTFIKPRFHQPRRRRATLRVTCVSVFGMVAAVGRSGNNRAKNVRNVKPMTQVLDKPGERYIEKKREDHEERG